MDFDYKKLKMSGSENSPPPTYDQTQPSASSDIYPLLPQSQPNEIQAQASLVGVAALVSHNLSSPYNNTVIVNTQPQRVSGTKQGEWTVDLCDCFSDINECFCACCCPFCMAYQLYNRANEGICSCLCTPLQQLRTKIRLERGIHGTLFGDMCATHCCPCCSMIQMGIEMKRTYPRI